MNWKMEKPHVEEEATLQHGVTLRDYFAAAALQSLLTSDTLLEEAVRHHHHLGARDAVAASAYDFADSMLRARGQS
jgi:hypothetical protein